MTTREQLEQRARAVYQNEALQRKWVESVLRLGNRWLLATPVQPKPKEEKK